MVATLLANGTTTAMYFGTIHLAATQTLADICLVPQLGNARRFGVEVSRFHRLLAAEAACIALPAFANATPGKQPDAE